MSANADCPEPARLAEYARAELPSEAVPGVERHLAACRACLDQVLEHGQPSLVPEIPNCHIVREIGRGRFGVVYKAWRLGAQPGLVALKVLGSWGEMEESRFDREVAVLKKLDSPGIVKCLDAGQTGEAKYYIMDYVEGVHLDEYVSSPGRDLADKLAVFERVCRAVSDAHAAGVVHRDLKPSNILVDANDRPHVLDFGICGVRPTDWSSWQRCTITHPGDVVGTLKYMSPEQAWGGVAGPIDERSDLWSLGVMLYGIVTDGDYPYSLSSTRDRPAPEALLERIRKELPRLPKLESLPQGRDLEVLVERCLAWEPNHRIESAARLTEDLARYRAGEPIRTRPLGTPYRLKRLVVGTATRSRWVFAMAFIALVGLALRALPFVVEIAWLVPGDSFTAGTCRSGVHDGLEATGEGILVVGVFDDTARAVRAHASRAGLEGVTADSRSWRAVHGHLMTRLAAAGPRAVVWDYFFRSPRPADAEFAAGVLALTDAGVPTVLAVSAYRDDGRPELSAGVTGPLGRHLHHGAIVARDMVQRPGEFVLAVRRPDGTTIPSLALASLAAMLHPNTQLDVDWTQRNKWINLLYETSPEAYRRERDRVELSRVFKAGTRLTTFQPGDLLASTKFALHRPEYWRRQTVAYEALLACTDDELHRRVRNRLVLFGDLRVRPLGLAADRHEVKYASSTVENVPGCYLLADAITGLLNRQYLHVANPLSGKTYLVMLCVAAIGCLLPLKLAGAAVFDRPTGRRALWLVLLALGAVSFGVMAQATTYAAVHLGIAGFCLAGPLAGAFAVEFARNRHRILDRSRQVLEGVDLGTRGTITVTPQRQKSTPAIV